MQHMSAARIVALRPAIESLIFRMTANPETIITPMPNDELLIDMIKMLSKPISGQYGSGEPPKEGGGRGEFR